MTYLVERLAELRRYLDHLVELRFRSVTAARLDSDLSLRNDVLFSLLMAVQLLIDVAGELSARRGLAFHDYTEAVRNLRQVGGFAGELVERLARLPGFRNVLMHEYVRLDYDRVLAALADLEPPAGWDAEQGPARGTALPPACGLRLRRARQRGPRSRPPGPGERDAALRHLPAVGSVHRTVKAFRSRASRSLSAPTTDPARASSCGVPSRRAGRKTCSTIRATRGPTPTDAGRKDVTPWTAAGAWWVGPGRNGTR